MNNTDKPSECINEERDEWHPGLIPEWDGSMPQRKTDYKTLKQAAEAIGGGD